MELFGVLDDAQPIASVIPPMRSYAPGPLEQAEVIKTWNFIDVVEPTPNSPHVSQCILLLCPFS